MGEGKAGVNPSSRDRKGGMMVVVLFVEVMKLGTVCVGAILRQDMWRVRPCYDIDLAETHKKAKRGLCQ